MSGKDCSVDQRMKQVQTIRGSKSGSMYCTDSTTSGEPILLLLPPVPVGKRRNRRSFRSHRERSFSKRLEKIIDSGLVLTRGICF